MPFIRVRALSAAAVVAAVLLPAIVIQASNPKFFQAATQADFLRGDVENLSLDPQGQLTLGPATELVYETAAPFLWALVTQPDGTKVNWNVELAARSALVRQGWTQRSINIGDSVTVEGSLARSGVNMVNARAVVLPDGKKVFSGENQ